MYMRIFKTTLMLHIVFIFLLMGFSWSWSSKIGKTKIVMFIRVRTLFHAKNPGKDFPGPFLEISRTVFWRFTSNQAKCSCWMKLAWHCDIQVNPQNACRNARKWELENMCKPDMHSPLVAQPLFICESNERVHWEQKTHVFTHFVSIENVMLCLSEHLFSLAFIPFKALKALIFFDLVK